MEAQATQTTTRKNRDRFTATTGKTEKEYQQWASQVGRQMHTNTINRMPLLILSAAGWLVSGLALTFEGDINSTELWT